MVRVGGNLNPAQQKQTLTENQHFRLDNGLEDSAKTTQDRLKDNSVNVPIHLWRHLNMLLTQLSLWVKTLHNKRP